MTNTHTPIARTVNPTPEKVRDLQLGIALSQTAYELNNGFGIQPGKPLSFLEDSALMSAPGARPLKVSIPEGFVVTGTFNDEKTGMDALLAFNKTTGEVVIGFAGTNGFGNDAPDTKQDIVSLGVGQAKSLYDSSDFQRHIRDIKFLLAETGIPFRLLIAGQSLGGGVATTLGLMLVHGDQKSGDLSNANRIKLDPSDIAIVSVNGFGSEYSAKLAGFTPAQIEEFYSGASLDRIVVRNAIDGNYDLISQLGGRFGGTNWILNAEMSRSIGELHRLNFGVAEGLDNVYGDLTRISSGEVPLINHETISRNAFLLDSAIPLANNKISLSWSSYVAMLFSKPGEGATTISHGLHRYAGFPKPLADVFGVVGEVVLRALPVTQAAQAMRFLLGGYVAGQLIGSSESPMPVFDVVTAFGPVPEGWTRQQVFAGQSRVPVFVIDRNPETRVEVIRRSDGRSIETHPDGTRIETHPEYGMAVLRADGSGTLFLKGIDERSGDFSSATVTIPRGAMLDLKEGGWHLLKPLDEAQALYESAQFVGTKASISEIQFELGADGKPTDKILRSRAIVQSFPTHDTLQTEAPGMQRVAVRLGDDHVQFVLRDEDRRTLQTVDVITDPWRTETTYRNGQGQVTRRVIVEQLNADTTRTTLQGLEGEVLESTLVQRYRRNGDLFELEDHIDSIEGTRLLTVRDSQGFIRRSEAVDVNGTPVAYREAVREQLHDDIADFLTALRQKDTAGILLATARIALDYARSQGSVTARHDALTGGFTNGLALVQSLRSLQSGDTLARAGGAVGLLNSTNHFAGKLTGSGYLSSAQTAALSQIGAMLAVANLANLGKMIEAGQIGSAGATVVSAINGVGYLAGTSSALMGSGALIAINPIAMVVAAFVLDSLLGDDPPPPPPQGLAMFVRESDGRIGYRISESNPLGEAILRRELDRLLPKLASQLQEANASIDDDAHGLYLVASRMPSIQISAWPSHDGNGVDNYFFVLSQTDPLRNDPGLLGVSRLDLVKLYAETLLLPEALVQQWEVDHLQATFGPDESHWLTEGAWLRARSPIEQQRAQLQAALDEATSRWEAASKLSLALAPAADMIEQRGNIAALNIISSVVDVALQQMDSARAQIEAFRLAHPIDPLQAARATPEQEEAFALARSSHTVVALQWHRVLAVDLGNDGVQVIDLPGTVGHDLDSLHTQRVARVDIDGDGFREATQWVAPADAILGIDRSGNGLLGSSGELFSGWDIPFDQRGLASLAYYDANGDGRITSHDPAYHQLRLWFDLDGDGSAGSLEVFDLQMRSAALGFAATASASLASMAIEAIDLQASSVVFADGQRSSMTQLDLLAHREGVQIATDEATSNLNVLHENGLRENFITLVEDMSALQALQSPTLTVARRAELEALAGRYGLNPQSPDFTAIVQGLRATGNSLGSEETVIYFGSEDVWVDPAVRERLAALRISFRKLDGTDLSVGAGAQVVRVGQSVKVQSVKPDGAFDDRWVPGRKVGAADLLSDAAPQPPIPVMSGEHEAVPGDVTSLMLATKGAQAGGLVTRRAMVHSAPALASSEPVPSYELMLVTPATPLAVLNMAANEDEPLVLGITQLVQDARLQLAAFDPTIRLQLVGVRSASMGAVILDEEAGLLRFHPVQNFAGEAGFSYVLADQHGRLFQRTVQIRLSELNDAPLLAAESIRSDEDVPLLIDPRALLANDRDIEADTLAITGIARVALGRAELLGNGQIHYTPPSDMYGVTDTLEYIVRDSRGASAVGRLRIELAAVDDAPTVVAERLVHAREDQQLRIAPHLLLRNDIDPDADARLGSRRLRVAAVGSAEHGSVQMDRDGQIIFMPEADFNGEATFSYTVMDESGLATTGRAWVRIDAVNDAPLAAGERIAGLEDERLQINPALLLRNDIDTDINRGEPQVLSVVAVKDAVGGSVILRDGLIHFTPETDYAGAAGFVYLISDGHGGFAQATVDITLAPVNDAPRLPSMRFEATEDTDLVLPASRLLEGATDVDGDAADIRLLRVGEGEGGTVTWVDGQLRFRPALDFSGTASFSYRVSDGEGAETEGRVVVDVNGVNDAPIRIAEARLTPVADEDQEIRIAESALLKLFSDADGDMLSLVSYSLTTDGTAGRLHRDEARRELVFRGEPNANGSWQLRFTVTDGQALAHSAIDIRLRPVNDAPTVNAVGFRMLEDGGETNPTTSAWSYLSHDLLLSGAVDVDGDALSVASVSGARTTGVRDMQPVDVFNDVQGRRIGIRAPANYHGAIELSFTVTDGKGGETTQKAYGVVAPVNDVPLLTAQQTGASQLRVWRLVWDVSSWQLSAWDPDATNPVRLATERNPLRGGVTLSGKSTAPDARGGLLTVATILTQSGRGNATSTETAWFSATDAAGAKSQISISFIGRFNTDPVVIDFDQDGLRFIDLAQSRAMLEVDGVLRRSAWIGPNEGILAYDVDHDGRIRRLDEIAFGSHVGQPDISDLQALQQAYFDQNQDGVFDAADHKWSSFLIWRDRNGNGASDDGELQSLAEAGVRGLFLNGNVLHRAEGADVRVRGYTRALMHDGSLRQAADVWLRLENPQTEDAGEVDPSMQQVSLLGTDQLASLLQQLAEAPQEGNRAPLVYGYLPTQYAEEGQAFRLEIAPNFFIDADTDDPLRFAATRADGSPLPDWLRFDDIRLAFEGTPDRADAGALQLALAATDSEGASSRITFTLMTAQINRAPEVASPLDLIQWQTDASSHYTLPEALFHDPNGDGLTLEVTQADGRPLPDWLRFDPQTRSLSGRVQAAALQEPLAIAITATDTGGLSVKTATRLIGGRIGTAQDDWLAGSAVSDTLWGDAGNDTLVGGRGNDLLVGGAGSDVYIAEAGSGDDILVEEAGDGMDVNVLRIGGAAPDDVRLFRDQDSLYIDVVDGLPKVITVRDFYKNPAWDAISRIEFDSGEILSDLRSLHVPFSHKFTEFDDWFSAAGSDNWEIAGGKGNDQIAGGSGNDQIFGDEGDDTLDGGVGDDYLEGGSGRDTYRFGTGWGFDQVRESSTPGEGAVIEFGEGILASDIQLARDLEGLRIRDAWSGDMIRVDAPGPMGSPVYRSRLVSELRFSGGEVLTAPDDRDIPFEGSLLWHADQFEGSEKNDRIFGGWSAMMVNARAGDDLIIGSWRNDRLFGGAGNDLLEGGAGDDLLDGGTGDDVYVHYAGDGSDTISDPSGSDTLAFNDADDIDDLAARRSGADLWIGVRSTSGGVHLKNFFDPGGGMAPETSVEWLRFAGGEQISTAMLVGMTPTSTVLTGASAVR